MKEGGHRDHPPTKHNLCFKTLEALYTSEAALRGLHDPVQYAGRVVTVAKDVVTGRQAVRRTLALHFVELLRVEFVIADDAPIVCSGVHRETRRQ